MPLIDSHRAAAGERAAQFAALFENRFGDVSAGDHRRKDGFEFVAQGDALDGPERAGAVVARADEDDKGFPEHFVLRADVGAVEEILEHAGHVAEVFGCADGQAVAGQKIVEPGLGGFFQNHFDAVNGFRSFANGLSHLSGVSGLGMVND